MTGESREPARLLLARHGQTEWHAENRYAGRTDIGLTPTGHEEARSLARRALEEGPALVLCSPLVRSEESARPSAEACGVELKVDERLREVDFGEWEGRTLREIRAEYPEAAERFEGATVEDPFPGGDSLPGAAARALAALREVSDGHPGEKVLVVAHNTLVRLVLCSILGIPLPRYRTSFPRLVNTAISEARIAGEGGAIYSINDGWHLRDPVGAGDAAGGVRPGEG